MMTERFVALVANLPPEYATFLLAMTPIGEVRLSVPVAIIKMHLSVTEAIFWSALGNATIGAIAVVFLMPTMHWIIYRWPRLHRLWQRYIYRLETKHRAGFEKWGSLALVLFVAVPLPMTGIISGAIAAAIFQIPVRRAILLLSIGGTIAACLVAAATLMTTTLF